ncbi:MAG TPA: hypothetical protein VF035_07570 [Longimicrobiales bacterium]
MGLVIEYEVDGVRAGTPSGITDEDTRAIMEDLAAELREELSDAVCPVHGEHPLLVLSESDGEITVGVESCCEKLEDIMEARFTEGEAEGDADR